MSEFLDEPKQVSAKGIKKIVKFSILGLLLIVFLSLFGSFVEDVPADEIIINQYPFTGEIAYWTEPGFKWQLFGHAIHYDKTFQVWFSNREDEGRNINESIKIVFNDAGVGFISGSGRVVMPRDEMHLKRIREDYESMDALLYQLIYPTIRKVVFSSGPLMSSFESYAAKKNDLIRFIEDQLEYGVYRTQTEEKMITDPISGEQKLVVVAGVVPDREAPGGLVRQEESPFAYYGMTVKPITVNDIDYEQKIIDQISQQQSALMAVQTAKAEAMKAKQDAIKAEEQGKANAATAKWEQEVIKAKAVTKAQQEYEVAQLARKAAGENKQKNILDGQGEAEKRRLVMASDGALKQKLDALVEIEKAWAAAWGQNAVAITPAISGGSSQSGASTLDQFLQTQIAKNAQELGLDLKINKK